MANGSPISSPNSASLASARMTTVDSFTTPTVITSAAGFVPIHYVDRNPNYRARGANEEIDKDQTVWPSHNTAVNRGYIPDFLSSRWHVEAFHGCVWTGRLSRRVISPGLCRQCVCMRAVGQCRAPIDTYRRGRRDPRYERVRQNRVYCLRLGAGVPAGAGRGGWPDVRNSLAHSGPLNRLTAPGIAVGGGNKLGFVVRVRTVDRAALFGKYRSAPRHWPTASHANALPA